MDVGLGRSKSAFYTGLHTFMGTTAGLSTVGLFSSMIGIGVELTYSRVYSAPIVVFLRDVVA